MVALHSTFCKKKILAAQSSLETAMGKEGAEGPKLALLYELCFLSRDPICATKTTPMLQSSTVFLAFSCFE
jgi:hypothetical protein